MDYEEYLTEEERQALKTECPFYKDECSNHPKCNFKINHGCHLMKAGADILELGEKLNSIDERLNELESSIRWHNEDCKNEMNLGYLILHHYRLFQFTLAK